MKAIMVGLFASIFLTLVTPVAISALPGVVISQLQTGDTLSGNNEAVELYNNTSANIDVTNYCIRYSSYASPTLSSSPKYCFVPPDGQTQIHLESYRYVSIFTLNMLDPGGLIPDGRFTGSGMAGAGGHIKILDSVGVVRDTVGWGTAQYAEGYLPPLNFAPPAPNNSQSLVRKTAATPQLQDTDNNSADFELKTSQFRTGGLYEVRIPVDLCPAIDGIQEELPAGYGFDEAGDCAQLALDLCSNLERIQVQIPEGMARDVTGACYVDVCQNINGLQSVVPYGYRIYGEDCVTLESRSIQINEILPNVTGSDSGYEFIELYNPNDSAVDLSGYILEIGKNYEYRYQFGYDGPGTTLPAYGYVVFHDDELGFSLLNTTSQIRLTAPAGNVVSETTYNYPKEDEAWAYFAQGWGYTNQPTPLTSNTTSFSDDANILGTTTNSSLKECGAGKYRHPITNRCRNIETDTNMLVACDADEYRNPETNRCRKVASLASVLTPCNIGFERNPDTNRCRKIASASTYLTPCQPGYERNPATNRCRKSTALSTPAAIHTDDKPVANGWVKTSMIFVIGLTATGYGIYEWRSELSSVFGKLFRLGQNK